MTRVSFSMERCELHWVETVQPLCPVYMTTEMHWKPEVTPYLGNDKACVCRAFDNGYSTKFGIHSVISRQLPISPKSKM